MHDLNHFPNETNIVRTPITEPRLKAGGRGVIPGIIPVAHDPEGAFEKDVIWAFSAGLLDEGSLFFLAKCAGA